MTSRRALTTTLLSLLLALSPAVSSADPGKGKGPDHGNGQPPHGKDHGNPGGKNDHGKNDWHGGPSVDRNDIFGILGAHRGYWSPGKALPPGVQKNLARGKPLPPGIAKKLDGRLLGQLPRYDGYQWMQAGADLILVAVATGIIYEVLNGALD